MKLFPNTVNAVVKALEEIFDNNRYADKVIEDQTLSGVQGTGHLLLKVCMKSSAGKG